MKTSHFATAATLLLALAPVAHGQNLVLNPGFETGSLTDWDLTPAPSGSDEAVGGAYAHSGSFGMAFGSTGATPFVDDDIISQVLPSVAGDNYSLDFFLENQGGAPDDFTASVDGAPLLIQLDSPPFGYTEFTYTFVGAGSDTLAFAGRNFGGLDGLDDITVLDLGPAVTPEPGSIAMLGSLGLAGVGLLRRRRTRK